MKTIAFVPIKMNNERLPGKNIKKFSNGRPLISYILETLKLVEGLDGIYVYCSDPEIKRFLPDGVRYLKRDPYLDLSTTSFNEVLTSFAEEVAADIYVLTHATAPFIKKESFQKGIEAVKSGEYDSALAVRKMQEFLWIDGRPFNFRPEEIPRTQDLKPFYMETCGMYIYTSDLIKTEKRRVGDRTYLVSVTKIEACDINDSEDFIFADALRTLGENDLEKYTGETE